ncbi:transcriptional regulator, partial [Streptomyces adustus]
MSITASGPVTPSSLATTVPRAYVHKQAQSEVLLTGWQPAGDNRHRVSARWPLGHPFYTPADGLHDPLLIAETVRQCVPLLSHAAYGVPFGHRQAWSRFGYRINPEALTATNTDAAVELHITCTDVARRAGRLTSLTLHAELQVDGHYLGTAHTTFANLSPTVYPRLRGPYADLTEATRHAIPLAPPMPPVQVARTHHAD